MAPHEIAILSLYAGSLGALAVFGLHRYYMVYLYYRHRRQAQNAKPFDPQEAPCVTVQLPIFNEYYVCQRLIDSVAAMNYPRGKFEIQVLDDSTDETQELARAAVEKHRRAGLNIHYIRRESREGYKAGALDAGLQAASGEFLAIFDADFMPPKDLLERAIPHFSDPSAGMVQLRWDHINRDSSLLTRIQSIMLDGHFVIEHTARNLSGRFFNFNGTAGIWRRQAIEDAGGWQHDTLTEDLDLSYRSQLAGWRFVYRPEITAPGEVPVDINGFKSQQRRWTKGAIQTGVKLLRRIWSARIPRKVKIEATFHLSNNLAYPLMLILSLAMWPALQVRMKFGLMNQFLWDLPVLLAATASVSAFYVCSQVEIRRGLAKALLYLPALMALGIGLSVSNSRAVLEGLFGGTGEFVRTPKGRAADRRSALGGVKYSAPTSWTPLIELALGAYFTCAIYWFWQAGVYSALPFLFLFQFGYLYIGLLSLAQSRIAQSLFSRPARRAESRSRA
jgi:cellulose synthase/poly-beta-1,6-N-acetylglucosamine synthase-like glycosyltransferase